MSNKREIVFYSTELSAPFDDVKEEMLIKDDILNKAITAYSVELSRKGIETWVIKDNIIVTEDGYKFCIYKDMLEQES